MPTKILHKTLLRTQWLTAPRLLPTFIPSCKSSTSTSPSPSPSPTDPIHRLSLRVGRIQSVTPHPDAQKLYIEEIDVGETNTPEDVKPRTIVSGLAPYYSVEELTNKHVIVVSNMKPTNLRGVKSYGMLLAAYEEGEGGISKVEVLEPPAECVPGDVIWVEGFERGPADPVLNPKKKVFESIQPFLKTTQEGVATYKGRPLCTERGVVRVRSLVNAKIS